MERADSDPVVKQYRSRISDTDLAIVRAVNARISLSARLQAYKREKGYDVVDPAREDWMLSYLTRANSGPLPAARLVELYQYLLEVSKAEARRLIERDAEAGEEART
jgi:chorismate mutase